VEEISNRSLKGLRGLRGSLHPPGSL
jgi:hypothetical protein